MPDPKGSLPPHWLDDVVYGLRSERQIAFAIAQSPELRYAIEQGLAAARRLGPRIKGPSGAQIIRQSIIKAINDADGYDDPDEPRWESLISGPPA